MTSQYSHCEMGCNLKLREAVTQLETTYTTPILSYEGSALVRPELRNLLTLRRIREMVGGPNGI